jgi:serine palmitoyltransferase
MGVLMNVVVLTAAVVGGLYYYDRPLLEQLWTSFTDATKEKARAVSLDYYQNLSALYSDDDKVYAFYTQALALGLIAYVTLFKRSYDPSKKGYGGRAPTPLSQAEQDALIEEWQPQPLINLNIDTRPNELGDELVLESRLGATVRIRGFPEPVLNLSGFDFLNMSGEEGIRAKTKECLAAYGCGSCGPRGFYGTSDQHLALENALRDFFGTEEAIIYSDAASTMSSILPAFAKRGDVVVADAAVSESALAGIELSRATARYFKHNDVQDLDKILKQMVGDLKRKGKNLGSIRRYVVVEGLYRNTGDFAPLKEIVACARQHKFRVVLDDTFATGTVGATGRGSLERAGLAPTDVDFLAGSLATAIGSVGGFCTGSHVAVDHQRLAGAGYCFSASAPPFTCVAATEALKLMDKQPAKLARLRANVKVARKLAENLPNVRVVSDPESPLIFLELADEGAPTDPDDRFRIEKRLQNIVDTCLAGGAGVGGGSGGGGGGGAASDTADTKSGRGSRRSSKRLALKDSGGGRRVLVSRVRSVYPLPKSQRPALPNPALRITVSTAHSEADLQAAFATLAAAMQ